MYFLLNKINKEPTENQQLDFFGLLTNKAECGEKKTARS